MAKVKNSSQPAYREERKYRRFSLCYPVQVKFHDGNSLGELQAVTKNVSRGGLLLESTSAIGEHCPVSFTMHLQGGAVVRVVPLVGEGEVVRVEPSGSGAGFAIAVKCKHPISQMKQYL
jgi:hypothetical protein